MSRSMQAANELEGTWSSESESATENDVKEDIEVAPSKTAPNEADAEEEK